MSDSMQILESPPDRGLSRLYENRIYSNGGIPELMDQIEADITGTFLDVGCGTGANAQLLRARFRDAFIVGMTLSQAEAKLAEAHFDELHVGDIETCDESGFTGRFNGIIFSHVLEHLASPEEVLLKVRPWLTPNGRIYVAVPNVAFYKQRVRLMVGEFEYTPRGLMDNTHLRFFTFNSARTLIEKAGYSIERHTATGSVPLRPLRSFFPTCSKAVDKWFTGFFPNVFGWQIIMRAR